jgi:predicted chitinase
MGFKNYRGSAVSGRPAGPTGHYGSAPGPGWNAITPTAEFADSHRSVLAAAGGSVAGEAAPSVVQAAPAASGGFPKVTKEQLLAIAPNMNTKVSEHVDQLNEALEEFEINTALRQAMFLATVTEETGGFLWFEEGGYLRNAKKIEAFQKKLRYYPWYGRGLIQLTWQDNYQKASDALKIGDEHCKTVWKKKKVGKNRFEKVSSQVCHYDGLLGDNRSRAEEPDYMFRTAAWYWRDRGKCNAVIGDKPKADLSDFLAASIRVNGKNASGYPNGWKERLLTYKAALNALSVDGREEVVKAIDDAVAKLTPPKKPAAKKAATKKPAATKAAAPKKK